MALRGRLEEAGGRPRVRYGHLDDHAGLPSLEEYLTEGARNAFAWSWQQPSSTAVIDALRARSLRPDSGPERIMARLIERGLSSEESSALHEWLGADACLLLEAD